MFKTSLFKINLSFRHQFLIFFVLSSILPLLVFSGIFLHKSTAILLSRNEELLQTGIILWEEVMTDTLDKLELTANHLAFLAYNNQFPQNIAQNEADHSAQWPESVRPVRERLLVVRTDRQGNPLSTAFPAGADATRCAADVRAALQPLQAGILRGHSQKGLFSIPGCHTQGSLMLMVAVPVYSRQSNAKAPSGSLVLGQNIESLIQSKDMAQLPRDFIYRIVEKSQAHRLETVAATLPGLHSELPPPGSLRRYAASAQVFEETTNLKKYRSRVHSLRDAQKNIKGYVIVSLPQYYVDDLAHENTLYVVAFLIIAIMLLTLLGARFNRLFIQPMHMLSAASRQVAAGDLNIRIQLRSDDAEMAQTLSGFNRMLDQLQEKEIIRKTFISTLTHDLRTPLIAQKRVLEFFRAYVKPDLDEQSGKLLEDMHQSNQNLMDMINHLLETFQYESGRINLHPKPTNLRALVDQCFQTLRPMAAGKHIELENQIAENFLVQVDGAQFQRVLQNLLGNSLQNIADGDAMSVSAHHDSDGERIIVSDTGPGIPADLLPHLFERYPQHLRRQQQIGSGLGLFICKMIIELHGGTISVSSVLEQGTVFEIRLPKTGKTAHHG